ncbi:MAG TPA: T9SS type A sorting domain-containing protein [Bacteroidota bacterium]|nr:T9SS type A sorting domain-containing protein [Bacteroidota bacterium]
MHESNNVLRGRLVVFQIFFLIILISAFASAQSYRTFSQADLSTKSAMIKGTGSSGCFIFKNTTLNTVDGLHAKLNGAILSVQDSGGFPTFSIAKDGKTITASGLSVVSGDSVEICVTTNKKGEGLDVDSWYWTTSGDKGVKQGTLLPIDLTQYFTSPSGGTVRDYLYKKVVTRPTGLVIGIIDAVTADSASWIRYMKSDSKYFPQTGTARGLDSIANGKGGFSVFLGELKNPHVEKHNNNLLGEFHALKLAIIANDSGVSLPDTPATKLGDLVYFDSTNGSDPCNGLTLRQVEHLADSALSYWRHFTATDDTIWMQLDSSISRINRAFGGPYVALDAKPLKLAGTQDLSTVPFLHASGRVSPGTSPRRAGELSARVPQTPQLFQNYPNPFNPTTEISFMLPKASVVTLKVFNVIGQEVETLYDRAALGAGQRTAKFNAANLPSGMYFYRLNVVAAGESQMFQDVKRMLLVK